MDFEPVNWFEKAADWAWLLLLAIGGAMISAFRRQSVHEQRIKTLEDHHIERSKKLSDIERKIDQNQHMLLGSLDKLRDDFRGDIRLLLSKALDKVPPG